tara:strand:+ start:97890 stop:98798 length:909 start_codon:yes stop_codon:yes gene_type:complete
MRKKKTVIVLSNDKALYNIRYRRYLLEKLKNHYGEFFVSFGTVESFFRLIQMLCFVIQGAIVVSSNLKTNVISLLLFSRGVLILNGLGRHQKSTIFRRLFICGVLLNRSRKIFFVQRYRDYRWLRRFIKDIQIHWMKGSGAEPLKATELKTPDTYLLISRPEKLKLLEKNLMEAAKKLGIKKLLIYGVNPGYQFQEEPDITVLFKGYVEPSTFFFQCKNFLQVDGYGEGFPHTLAYALCSKTKIVIDKRLSRSLGIYRLPVKRTNIGNGFERLEPYPEVVEILSNKIVYQGIISQVEGLVNV